MTLYHGLGNYLAISPAQYGMARSDQHLGWTTKGDSSLHYIVPPIGHIFSRTAWLRVTPSAPRVCPCGHPTPKVTVTQKAPKFSDSPSTYKRRLLCINRKPLDIGGSEKYDSNGSRLTR
jgi:hypothetical protein